MSARAELAVVGEMLSHWPRGYAAEYRESSPGEIEAERPKLSGSAAFAVCRIGWDHFAAFFPPDRIVLRDADGRATIWKRQKDHA